MSIRLPEHCIHLYKHAVFGLITVITVLMLAIVTPCHAEQNVVLIAGKGSGIEELSNRDIRRIFLGLKSADNKRVNKPVLNLYNRDVYEDFLKNVMHMTEGAYKRKLVKRVFRHGNEQIKELDMLNDLNEHLSRNIGDISFVDFTAVEKMQDIEVVKVLW